MVQRRGEVGRRGSKKREGPHNKGSRVFGQGGQIFSEGTFCRLGEESKKTTQTIRDAARDLMLSTWRGKH